MQKLNRQVFKINKNPLSELNRDRSSQQTNERTEAGAAAISSREGAIWRQFLVALARINCTPTSHEGRIPLARQHSMSMLRYNLLDGFRQKIIYYNILAKKFDELSIYDDEADKQSIVNRFPVRKRLAILCLKNCQLLTRFKRSIENLVKYLEKKIILRYFSYL